MRPNTWSHDPRQLTEALDRALQRVFANSIIELVVLIYRLSPVDTGAFRANWHSGPTRPPIRFNPNTTSRNIANLRVTARAVAMSPQRIFWHVNDAPYAQALERGRIGGAASPRGRAGRRRARGVTGATRLVLSTTTGSNGPGSAQAPNGILRVAIMSYPEIINRVILAESRRGLQLRRR